MFQKQILKTLIKTKDQEAYSFLHNNNLYKSIFTEKENLELYKYLNELSVSYNTPPSQSFLKEVIPFEKNSSVKKTFEDLFKDKNIEVTDNLLGLIGTQLNSYVRKSAVDILREASQELKLANGSEVKEITNNIVDRVSELTKLQENKREETEGLIYHSGEQNEANEIKAKLISQYDLKKSGSQGYFKMKLGMPQLDDVIGGIHSVSFIAILGFVKNGKSFLARKIAYDALCQGKNVMFVSLEMSYSSILDSFMSLHANNTSMFGFDSPKIKTGDIRAGTLSKEAEDFYKNQVIDSFTTDKSLGVLYIKQPTTSRYTPSQLFSDVRVVTKTKMDIDLLVIDYPGRMSPDYGAKSRDSMNEIFLQIRNFGLANNIPIVYPVQCNRAGYESALKNKENLFTIDAIGDYSAIEKESTDIISIITTPDMKVAGQSQIQHLLSRESGLAQPFRINSDFETGILSPISGMSKEDANQLLQEIEV